ncbi:MAG: Slp/YeaY family lipoprotein [candidate division NC10 bacterium]|nr:Slp/YeaY family lipoprotein [candidate division NC10 bacterium]
MDRRITLFLVLAVGVALIPGCASVVPEALEKQVDRQVRFIDLQPDPGRFAGRMVVLGGEIVGITRSGELTELEVAELPLDAPRDRPKVYAVSRGRFVVAHRGSLDPERFRPGRAITVVGRIRGGRMGPGQDNPEPVIESEYLYLWPEHPVTRLYSSDPYYYDPFYYHPFYHRSHFFGHRHHFFGHRFCD